MVAPTAASHSAGNDALQYPSLRNAAPGADSFLAPRSTQLPAAAPSESTQLSSEYYSEDSLSLTYTNADGDTVSLSMQHVEYQKAVMQFDGSSDSTQWKDIVDFIKKEFERLNSEMMDRLIASITGDDPKKKTEKTDDSADIAGLPEYWNAENTSQRIVDFAVSFHGAFDGAGKDFLDTIRAAVDEGFKQARDSLGKLPDEVDALVSATYDLVMKKLDEWAAQQGIEVDGRDGTVAAA
jgi:hypothetical protein